MKFNDFLGFLGNSLRENQKQLYQGQLAASSTTLYTAPTLTAPLTQYARIDELIVCNTDTVSRTFTIYIVESGGSAAANRAIFSAVTITAGQTLIYELYTNVPNGGTIRGLADSASKVTVTISGTEFI